MTMSLEQPVAIRPWAVITGASSGIGYELLWLFAHDGYNLAIVSRDQNRLETIASAISDRHGINVIVLAKDLSRPEAAAEVVDELTRAGIAIQVLVNNAGFATYGPFVETSWDDERRLMQVNMVTLTELTKLVLPGMLSRHEGRILNVASTAAFWPGPLMAVYYASKAYVLSFSEALAEELRGTGVTVTALCPGPTRTGFQERAAMTDSRMVRGEIMGASEVARLGYAGLLRGQLVVVPGIQNKLQALAPRFLPAGLAARITRKAQERIH